MKAISIRVEHVKASQYSGQRAHDLRDGHIPDYVSRDRIDENSLLVCPPPAEHVRELNARAAARANRRAPNQSAAIAASGVLTFGVGAQAIVGALDKKEQDERIRRSVEMVASRFGTEVIGLVVHRDESAIHAHFMLRAICDDGQAFSRKCTRQALSEMQDIAAEAFKDLEITRGKRKIDRIRDGEDKGKWVHKTVAELHRDLPADLAKKQQQLEQVDKKLAASERKLAEVMRKLEAGEGEVEKLQKLKERYEKEIARFQKAAQQKAALEPPQKGLLGYRAEDVERFVAQAHRAVAAVAASRAVVSLDAERAALAERERQVEQREQALEQAARQWQEVQQRQQAALAERERQVERREQALEQAARQWQEMQQRQQAALSEREQRIEREVEQRAQARFEKYVSALEERERVLDERRRSVYVMAKELADVNAAVEQRARARVEQLSAALSERERLIEQRERALAPRERQVEQREQALERAAQQWQEVQQRQQAALAERERQVERRERLVDREVEERFERVKPGLLAKAYADLEMAFEARVAKAAEERAAQLMDAAFDRRVKTLAEQRAREIIRARDRRDYDIER